MAVYMCRQLCVHLLSVSQDNFMVILSLIAVWLHQRKNNSGFFFWDTLQNKIHNKHKILVKSDYSWAVTWQNYHMLGI